MGMIEAVVFDVDGTLVDTVDMHASAWQRAFREFGREFEFAAIRGQIGKGGDQLLPVFLSDEELEEFGEAVEKRRGEIFKADYLPQARAFPKVRELMERIKAARKRIALASSAPEDELEVYIKLTNIGDLIEAETSGDDAKSSKPAPDIFEAALAKLGNPEPAACVAVGDTPYDAIAARKAGMQAIGVLCGGFPEKDLRQAGCAEIYQDAADLLARFEESIIGRDTTKSARI